ncbi:tetracycline resistance efflux pump [Desulfohalotomaculum tongense]|uniref:Na+/H+ antiporter NhaC family protein n=1 Tax=Desulforadius tongensis TaxID=1216062 RepID=UPI00195BCB43|nr:Na+/H+ antiporter NhaC family protein [Desulforadius tongensis]MBM7855415.1 tetracycline resistance efflux pump [Desulforadius tongensis]
MEYGWLSVIPPLIAITAALITKEVLLSLFLGIFVGAFILSDYSLIAAFEKTFAIGFKSMSDPEWNIPILAFLFLLGGLTALISASGGSRAFGEWALARVKSRTGAQMVTMLLGIIIFIDDYFNSLAVGQVARPITDRHRVSRAKLAYIIDSTAAPVCIIAPLSSWGAYIITVIADQLKNVNVTGIEPLTAFITMIPMNIYAILTLLMVIVIAVTNVEFGPMAGEEKRALKTGQLYDQSKGEPPGSPEVELSKDGTVKGKVIDLVLPILGLIFFTTLAMLYTGGYFGEQGGSLMDAFLNTAVSISLVYGAALTIIFAAFLYLPRKQMKPRDFIPALLKGMQSMVTAIVILVLAWAIGGVIGELGTGKFLASKLSEKLPVYLLPSLAFALSGLMAFATGTSWGTFGIMLPIAAPMAAGAGTGTDIILMSMAAVLAGAVYGDHISPISDTTILSSTGAACHHIDHVRTQLPYATLVAAISMVGYIIMVLVNNVLAGLGFSILLLIGAVFALKKGKLEVE